MTDPSSQADRPLDLARSRAAARAMTDKDLTDLHAQGRDALRPGAWEVLDEELRRRARVGARQPRVHVEGDRYPTIRTTVVLLKGLAALVLVAAIVAAVIAARTSAAVAVLFLLVGLLGTVSYWAVAELYELLMDIEANTRALRERSE